MEEGEIIEAEVQEVHPGYIKIEYEGKSATLQITELTWKPGLVDSSRHANVGQKLRVKVIKILGDAFSVSMREASLGGNPWDNPPKIGEEYFAPVVFITDYGYFFELTYFCHALMKSENVNQKMQLGDRVKVRVSKVNLERRQVEVVPVSLA